MSISQAANKIIEYAFYALIFLVPLVWLPATSELFEFNKMILVYLMTAVVLTAWLLKSVDEKAFTINKTPLDIPIAIFLLANIISTVLSIDTHTSIFGYYSRFNGGLLSTFSYIILFYALVTFFDKEKLVRLLKILLVSSALVALYAILQHPNPFFRNPDGSFRGIDAGYWRQNSQARVFSTFGQPNWLAAFLAMVIPFALFFLIFAKKVWEKATYTILLIGLFVAFTFTYSRGGTIGFVTMLLVLAAGAIFVFRDRLKLRGLTAHEFIRKSTNRFDKTELKSAEANFAFIRRLSTLGFREGGLNLKTDFFKKAKSYVNFPNAGFFLLVVLAGWILTFLVFGNAFTTRGINLASLRAEGETQLATYGSETGKIRLIVWEGGLDIFKSYPLFGSGVETFAFSYYKFRPAEHNLTGEWTFLYNKAHNEFVNYLSTTGAVGFLSYMAIIITFSVFLLKILWRKGGNGSKFFGVVALSSFAGYLAQNFFGFSVVAIALLFYLIPGFVFILYQSTTERKFRLNFVRNPFVAGIANIGIFLVGTLLIIGTIIMWSADYYYVSGAGTTDLTQSYENLKIATALRPDEPLYKAELGVTTISIGATSPTKQVKKEKIAEGFAYLNQATNISPNNIMILRIRMNGIQGLSTVDDRYLPQALDTAKILVTLAPSDARTQYNLAVMYMYSGMNKEAQTQLAKVLDLKFNFKKAWELLLEVDRTLEDKEAFNSHKKEYEDIYNEKAEIIVW